MRRRLLAVFVGLTLLVLAVHDIPLAIHLRAVERDRLATSLERDAFTLAGLAEENIETFVDRGTNVSDFLTQLADRYASTSSSEIVITDVHGLVLASSDASARLGANVSDRASISLALEGVRNTSIREGSSGERQLVVAVPVLSGPTTKGAVEFNRPVSAIDGRVSSRLRAILAAAVISLLLAALIGSVLAQTLTEPLRRLRKATRRIAGGELTARADVATGPPEIRDLADDFNTMVARLEQAVADQRDFAGDASHQLRTPLTTLRLRVDQILDDDRLDASQRGALEAARGELRRMERLVEGLLALARAGASSADRRIIDAAAIARDRFESWEALASESGVVMEYRGPDTFDVWAVDGALEQIIDNAVANALDHATDLTRIEIRLERSAATARLEVRDDGQGLSDEDRANAFDRFWRGPDSAAGGSGVGLAVVKRLAEACNGTARLLPNDPHGLVVEIRLPVIEPYERTGRKTIGRMSQD
jgi:signal transduction histidine kinase